MNMYFRGVFMTQRYSETVEEAAQIARVVLPWISERQLPASPTNYTVAYEYLSRRNPELCAEAERALASTHPATQEIMDDLFRKFLSGELQDAVVGNIRDELSRIFMEALSALSSGGDGLARYKQRLLFATEQLSAKLDLGAVRGVVSEMIAETRRMQAAGEEMHAHLEATCGELESLREEFQQVQHEVTCDPLTGALNRRGLDKELASLFTHADAAGAFSLLMVDIDHFKQFNDKYGHVIGDEVLKYVARVLGKNTRGGDVLARYGGEEFVVLLPQTSLDNALHVGRNIVGAIRTSGLTHKSSGRKLDLVTLSVGVAAYRPDDTPASLIERADAALYAAKNAGRDRAMSEDEQVAI